MKVHFLGIAGSGSSAIANIAASEGFEISGCDKSLTSEFTSDLPQDKLFSGHSEEHLKDIDILAVTPAIYSLDPNNPELVEAKKKGIKIQTWQEFMGEYLEKDKTVIAICGTHGKSTTTAMVGDMLEKAGADPIVELGAVVNSWKRNFRTSSRHPEANAIGSKRGYFITEADEFNDNFLVTHPNITIVTTIEMDHPEYFKDFKALKESYLKFFYQTKDLIIANLSDPGVADVLTTFQKDKEKKYHPQIIDYSKSEILFPLLIPGKHNLLNAAAVFQLGIALGIDSVEITKALESFTGISRRFEHLGKYQGAEVFTDFGHHPTEIEVTIKAAREKFPNKKLILIFQPHMFSRTKALFDDFVRVLKKAPVDQVILMDIYPSREVDTGLIKSWQIAESAKSPKVIYNGAEEIKETLHRIADEDTVLFFMGAGDIDNLARKLASLS